MADAKNTNQVLSQATPQSVIDETGSPDVLSIGYYDASTDGNLLGGGDIGNNPTALVLGEKYEHAANSLIIRQPVTVGSSNLTEVNNGSGYAVGATTINVDSTTDIEDDQYVAIEGGDGEGFRAYKVSSHTTTSITIDPGLVFAIDDNADVRLALETEEAAERKLRGLITHNSTGIYVAYFRVTWENTHSGTVGLMGLDRTHIAHDAWTYS